MTSVYIVQNGIEHFCLSVDDNDGMWTQYISRLNRSLEKIYGQFNPKAVRYFLWPYR